MDPNVLFAGISALAAAASTIVVAIQLRAMTADRRMERRAEIEGVSVSWKFVERPHAAEPDGLATWKVIISAHNPGRLPVREISVRYQLPEQVDRVRWNGDFDDPTDSFQMGHPVLTGSSSTEWTRRFRMPWGPSHDLRDVSASISFRDMDGVKRTNTWPSGATSA